MSENGEKKLPRQPIPVKNLAEFKRLMRPGTEFVTTQQANHPGIVGLVRVVGKVQSNAFYSTIKDHPESQYSYWNDGKGMRTDFEKASKYTYGTEEGSVSPDGYSLDLYYAATIPDYAEKQSDLIFDYQNNVKLYPAFQAYLRQHQPPLLAIWGKDDPSFIWNGAEAFRKDLPEARIVPVDSGHFALENCCAQIAQNILEFFESKKLLC